MSIKSQLNSARDFLMAGMRASSRVGTINPQAEKVLRACMDLVETLVRQPPENITVMDVGARFWRYGPLSMRGAALAE